MRVTVLVVGRLDGPNPRYTVFRWEEEGREDPLPGVHTQVGTYLLSGKKNLVL